MIKIVEEKDIHPFTGDVSKYIMFHSEFFISLLEKYTKQAVVLFLFYVKYILQNGKEPTKQELFNISGFSNQVFETHFDKIKSLMNILPDEPKQSKIESTDDAEEIKTTYSINNEIVKKQILVPYYNELKAHGYGAILLDDSARKVIYRNVRSFYSKHKSYLSPQDIVEILIMGLHDKYLIKNGMNCNTSYIFKSILPKYLTKKKQGYKPAGTFIFTDNKGNVVDAEQFGSWTENGAGNLIFVEPKSKKAKYFEYKKEYLNRLNGRRNKKYDFLFEEDGATIKEEYEWCFGLAGKNNRFVKRV